jgi:hypothetical protein
MNKYLVVLLALSASGCATWGPTWSEVTGTRYYGTTTLNRRPAVIQTIDGNSSFPTRPIKIEPGTHSILLAGPAPGWPDGAPMKTMTLVAKPCERYYLNAQFDNRVQPTWTPVVDYVEPIAGCTVPAS